MRPSDIFWNNVKLTLLRNPGKVQSKRESVLCDHLWPVIYLLRIFGNYPIRRSSSERVDGNSGLSLFVYSAYNFSHRITWHSSILSVFNLIGGVLFCVFLSSGILEVSLQVSSFRTPLERHFSELVNIGQVATRAVLILFLWGKAGQLSRIMNNWTNFELKFDDIFKPIGLRFEPKFRLFKTFVVWVYLGLCNCGGIFMLSFGIIPAFGTGTSWAASFLIAWQFILVLLSLSMEDSKCLIMVKNLQLSYQQIRVAIVEESRLGDVSTGRVSSWWELIHLNRKQCELVGEYLKSQELVNLWEMIFNVTSYAYTFIYLLAVNGWAPNDALTTVIMIATCGRYFFCYYVKILVAESFYKEERSIVRSLLEIVVQVEGQTKAEVQFIATQLVASPSRINFGNYAHLEKPLLLKIFGQVITYLIVILQFANTPKSVDESKCSCPATSLQLR